ncbi:PRC-barrel domain-containing protein [Actinoplanes sp. SE50]|uniref:PRC-barrel domain-containing protein n=1 Tax=unclassified Actinoplanes TaxID=2626549 RepID=UPI00023ECD43|nr:MULTISPECIES: PRC-barrel domain-containing protein [unclassified Actinoplanes]AEV86578.1 PRC-barrel domain protein [Actinoplanes sp. SE50/110]ATO84976.1 PRC-barrel domain-containing protein [Actinoplanes sp. SE50]SLM02385.1 PRC-barrel domain-containing protein [Actinoplanes sp. SE50/110]
MTTPNTGIELVRLSDSDQMVGDPAEDVRGRQVRDRDGHELGRVDDLLIDPAEHRVRMLCVAHGGILGFGATSSFVPIEAIRAIDDDVVHVSEPKQIVAEAPRYDPALIDASEYYNELYRHYGYAPFWSGGYLYPGYPYYRI